MFLQDPLLLVLSVCFTISATPLQPVQDSASELSLIPSLVKAIYPLNVSVSPVDASEDNGFKIRCDGDTYGYNPNVFDCEVAKEYVYPGATMYTFGERHTGLPDGIVPLPYRVMGDRGLCYVQAVLIGDHETAKATWNMIRRAAEGLVVQCASSLVSQGGIATRIGRREVKPLRNRLFQFHLLICLARLIHAGGDNHLAVIMGPYQMPITCRGRLPSWESCKDILYDMAADKKPEVFGPGSDPAVTEELPFKIDSCTSTASSDFHTIYSERRPCENSRFEMFRHPIQYR